MPESKETTVVSNLPKINCVLVSDSLTGKSTLCIRFIYREAYVEDIAGIYTEEHSTEYGIRYNLNVNVLGGYEDHERLRPLRCHFADVVIICFKLQERPRNFRRQDEIL